MPLVGCDPLQLPEALQDVAFVDDHVSVAPCPAGTIELFNDSVTVEPPPEDDDEVPPEPDEELELLELPEDEEPELPLDEELEPLLEDDEELLELDDELELLLEDELELLPEEGPSLLPPPPPHAASARIAHQIGNALAVFTLIAFIVITSLAALYESSVLVQVDRCVAQYVLQQILGHSQTHLDSANRVSELFLE